MRAEKLFRDIWGVLKNVRFHWPFLIALLWFCKIGGVPETQLAQPYRNHLIQLALQRLVDVTDDVDSITFNVSCCPSHNVFRHCLFHECSFQEVQ